MYENMKRLVLILKKTIVWFFKKEVAKTNFAVYVFVSRMQFKNFGTFNAITLRLIQKAY